MGEHGPRIDHIIIAASDCKLAADHLLKVITGLVSCGLTSCAHLKECAQANDVIDAPSYGFR